MLNSFLLPRKARKGLELLQPSLHHEGPAEGMAETHTLTSLRLCAGSASCLPPYHAARGNKYAPGSFTRHFIWFFFFF